MPLSSAARRIQQTAKRRKAERIAAKAKANAPAARPKTAKKPSTRAVPKNSTATPNKRPATPRRSATTTASAVEKATRDQENSLKVGQENAKTFMSIISGLPTDAKNRYLSVYTDFLALPENQQYAYLSGLEEQAASIVAPQADLNRDRFIEDSDFEIQAKEHEKKQLQNTFDKVVADMDFNKTRQIANDNETAAKVMQNVGNTAFVTGVAGSGIFSRRTFYVRESLQNKVEDANTDYRQQFNDARLAKGKAEQTLDAQIDRLFDLKDRGLTDLDQSRKQDELSLFFELAGNEFGRKGDQAADLLEAGYGSAAEDFAAGGTDDERRARSSREIADANRQSAIDSFTASRAREDQAAIRYKQLFDIRQALKTFGRTSEMSGIDAEMRRLQPSVNTILGEATSGNISAELQELGFSARPFFGNLGSGIGNLSDWENRWSQDFNRSNNLQYQGMNPVARNKLNKLLKANEDTIRQYSTSP